MNFHAFRQEPFPATLPPARKRRAAAFRAHPRAKAVLIFPGALRALQGSFHGVGGKERQSYGQAVRCQFLLMLLIVLMIFGQATSTHRIMSRIMIRSTR